MSMGDHRKLKTWQAARVLAGKTYRVTRAVPSDERFGMTMLADDLAMAPTDQLTLIQVELSTLRGMLSRLAKRLSDSLTDSR
jgi:hypothetical protein